MTGNNWLEKRSCSDSEERYRLLIRKIQTAIVLHDGQGRVLDSNPLAQELLGLSAEQLLGKFLIDPEWHFLREDGSVLPVAEYPASLVFSSRQPLRDYVAGISRPDRDAVTWVLVNGEPEYADDGEIAQVIVSFVDITGRRRIEDALFFVAQRGWLAGAENFFDALAQYLGETLDVDYVVIDRLDENPDITETVALYAKGAIVPNMRYALKGTPCENVMGRRLCLYPHGVQQMFPEDTLLAEMGVESYIGIPLWDSSGQPIGLIALMNGKPLADTALTTQLLQLVATRAAAELARERSDRILRTREHEFRTLAENLPDNIVRYDREGRTVYVNPVLEKTLGTAAADMIGKQVREIHPDGSYEVYAQVLYATLTSGENGEIELILPVPDKDPIVHQIRMIAERDDHGEVTGVLAIGRDITERKRAEEALHLQKLELEEEVAERQVAQENLQEKALLLEEEIEKRQKAQDELEKLNDELEQRVMLAELSAEIGCDLTTSGKLQNMLNQCSDSLVRHLNVAFVRIWTFNDAENVLELQASAGLYTRIDGSHSRVPVGKFKIGLIAEERKPHITNAVLGDPRVHDQEWAKREGMTAFAGHPLVVGDKLVGVMAMFSRNQLSDVTLKALESVSNEIAIGIERKRNEEALEQLNEELEQRVKQRTAELDEKNRALERFNKLFVNRELRMVELKERIAELEKLKPQAAGENGSTEREEYP